MQRPVLAGAHGAGAAGAKQVEGTWEGAEQGFGRPVETCEVLFSQRVVVPLVEVDERF